MVGDEFLEKETNCLDDLDTSLDNSTLINDKFMGGFFKASNRKKFKPKQLFELDKEVLNFRKEVHLEILENLTNFKEFLNASEKSLITLREFQKIKPFSVINCDKNVGTALIANDLYLKLTKEFLDKDPSYSPLKNNPLKITIVKINQKLDSLFINQHISKKVRDYLIVPEDSKLGNFKLMAKMHKTDFGWRPIINSINHPTSKLCFFLDFIFKPYVLKSDSYIKDSQNLIQICEKINFENEPFLYSLDFSSLYSNIEPKYAIPLIVEFMTSRSNTNHFDVLGLKEILTLIFEHNIFKFKDAYFVQNKGVAMGCICGPSLANLYLSILEKKWLTIHKPHIYARFIDDIFMALKEVLNFLDFQSNFNNLKLTMSSGDKVVFLDTEISFNRVKNKLSFDLYVKPTNNGAYLLPISEHPEHIFKNIPRNLFLRIRRICSEYNDFVRHAKNLALLMLDRGYKKKNLRRDFNQISNLDRNTLIPYKESKKVFKELNTLTIAKTYTNVFNCNQILRNSFEKTINKQGDFKLNIINKIGLNLDSLIVNGFKPHSNSRNKTVPCKNCVVCGVIYKRPSFFIDKFKINFELKSSGNCDSTHLVYIIFCDLCNKFYIGETEKSLSIRIKQAFESY